MQIYYSHRLVPQFFLFSPRPPSSYSFYAAPFEPFFERSTPWHQAAKTGNLSAIKTFHQRSTPVNKRNAEGLLPFQVALKYGHQKAAKLLEGMMPKQIYNGPY